MIQVQESDFDISQEYTALGADAPKVGAIATFIGLVRDFNVGRDKKPCRLG